MPTTPVNLIKGGKTSVETDYRDALPVNYYAVKRDILGAQGYMLCYPGLTQYATGEGIDRGGFYNDRLEEHYRVSGASLVSIDTDGTKNVLGTITGSSQAAMPYSFNTQCVVADGRIFLYDATTGFRQVADPFGGALDGVWVDQYYFFTNGDILYHTDITSEDTISLLTFATSEFSPDKTLGLLKTQDNKVIALNRYSAEYFKNDASTNFSFARQADRSQKIGIVATHAKCEAGGRIYITGGRRGESVGVYNLGLGSSTKVSTREVDKVLAGYTEPELSDMRMESYMQDNVTFVLVHLPNESYCFNESIAKDFGIDFAWTILKSDTVGSTPYRGINGVFEASKGKWVYGDKQNSNIGILDNTVCTHYGVKVEGLLFTPLMNLETMSVDQLELETIPGHTGSDDATVAVSITYNGITYGKEHWTEYGDPLDYGKNFILRGLGYVPNWCGYKFRTVTASRMAFALARLTYG